MLWQTEPPSPYRVSVASVPVPNPSIMANSTVMADVVVVTLAATESLAHCCNWLLTVSQRCCYFWLSHSIDFATDCFFWPSHTTAGATVCLTPLLLLLSVSHHCCYYCVSHITAVTTDCLTPLLVLLSVSHNCCYYCLSHTTAVTTVCFTPLPLLLSHTTAVTTDCLTPLLLLLSVTTVSHHCC